MTSDPDRFAPRATRAMGEMFDSVSSRYRRINALMTLGQDRSWRAAMWAAVPESAHVVLDLCTGEGSSLPGMRRPGRLVIGLDASLRMLEHAAATHADGGWAPRLVCGDAFRLPFRDRSVDVVTAAFGVRNLRPQEDALAEVARVLKPGGRLVVLEATLPRTGVWAPFHRFYLRQVVRRLGHLSGDPSAYDYLARSIEEFGAGEAFTRAAERLGFVWRGSRAFLLGATRLWVAQSPSAGGHLPAVAPEGMHSARLGESARGELLTGSRGPEIERRATDLVQFVLSAALTLALGLALSMMWNPHIDIPLDSPRRLLLQVLVMAALVVFGVRAVMFLTRLARPRTRI